MSNVKVTGSATGAGNAIITAPVISGDVTLVLPSNSGTLALTTDTVTTATNLAGGVASQIPYQSGAGTTAFIANGTAGQVLTSAGAATPTWSGISGGTF